MTLEKSLAPKLTNWRLFKLQNSNGHSGLQILEINLSFEAFKMILLYLINISFSFWNKKKWIWVLSPSIETSMGTACLYWWFFRILKEIKVSPITFKVMPNMGNTVSVVCRLEFVYGHHQLELNRPKGTILKNVLRFCWHLWIPLWIQPIQFAFFWFNLNRDRNYLLHMYLYTLCNRLFRTLTLKPGPSSH